MTFTEWQGTRVYWDDVSKHPFIQAGTEECCPGLVYDDGQYIQSTAGNDNGDWMLTLGNEGWITNDLLDLEKKLFQWAIDEGYEYEH